jgi:glycosyltransferase involved in cell wall biosynthesis
VRSYVVPCGVDIQRFDIAPQLRSEVRADLGVGARPVLCYCGGLDAWQCIEETLHLARALREAEARVFFLLLTRNDTAPWRAMLECVGQQGRDWVVLALAYGDVPRYLAAADLGVLIRAEDPVNAVASPTKLGEYLAAGVPLVTTPYAGDRVREVEASGCAFLLKQQRATRQEAHGLAAYVKGIMAERRDVCERCRGFAREELSRTLSVGRVLKCYQDLLGSANGGQPPSSCPAKAVG